MYIFMCVYIYATQLQTQVLGFPMDSTNGSIIYICRVTRFGALVHMKQNKIGTPYTHFLVSLIPGLTETTPECHLRCVKQLKVTRVDRCIGHKQSSNTLRALMAINTRDEGLVIVSRIDHENLARSLLTRKHILALGEFLDVGFNSSRYQRNFTLLR